MRGNKRDSPTEPTVDPQTIAGWYTRRGVLLAKLHHEPDGAWAWLWQMHLDIVDYLIQRYAAASAVGGVECGPVLPGDTASAQPPSPGENEATLEPDLPCLHGSARVAKAASLEGPAAEQLRENLRSRLSSLHTTNDKRRTSQPPIMPNLPPKRYRYRPTRNTDYSYTPHQLGIMLTRRTTYPEDLAGDGIDGGSPGIEPFDDTSLELFWEAIAHNRDWDLEKGEALTDEQLLRILQGEDPDGVTDTPVM